MPLSDVREGMKGTALTVFRGDKAEEFNVEILGVVPGAIGPKQDLIIGRIGGGQADRTFVFAGMSGSPVYIDGKLVGAISYSFPFAKEPIAGITPIEQMIGIFEQNEPRRAVSREPRPFSFTELASTEWRPQIPGRSSGGLLSTAATSPLMAAAAGQAFQPIATPVTFSGFSQETLNAFAPQLIAAGLLPVAAAGGSAPITPMKKADETTLVGGDSVSMQLTRGDYSMAAAGTVTMRDGEKVYAFGHPFLNLGSSDLPMAESSVVTVIPNVNNSFKLAVAGDMVGSMTQDRSTGVFGNLGRAPKMIPVRLELETSRGRTETIAYEVAKDDFLTPLLLNITVYNALIANERSLGDSLVELEGKIRIAGQEPVSLRNRAGGMQSGQATSLAVALPVNTLLRSNFDDLVIEGIDLRLRSTDGTRTGSLERIAVSRGRVRAGETVEIEAFVRVESGRIFVQKIPVTVPAGTPSGLLTLTVGDGVALQQASAVQQMVPKNLAELISMINRVKKSDRLYLSATRTTTGAIIGASELPNLPPSVLATINSERSSGGVKPTVLTTVLEQEIAPAEFLISGQQSVVIEIY